MKTVDLTPLKNNDVEYEKLASAVADHYKCDWNDSIHDSYGIYVKQVQKRTRSIHIIRCKAEELAKEAEELKIDEQVSKAADLCKEAENI